MGAAPHFRQREAPGGGEIADAGEVREATTRLPERQREALTLDAGGRSYEAIAAALGTNRDSVAQLVARARINLYDELRGTPLASVVPSPECERALSLIAAREDGQLAAPAAEGEWLEGHLAECDRCQLGEQQMSAATAALLLAPALAAGSSPGEARDSASRREARTASGEATVRASGVTAPSGRAGRAGGRPRRRTTLAAISAGLLLLLAGVALAVTGGDEATPVSPAADAASQQDVGRGDHGAQPANARKAKSGAAKRRNEDKGGSAGLTNPASSADQAAAAESTSVPTFQGTGGGAASEGQNGSKPATSPSGGSGEAVDRTRQTAASKPSTKPKATPAPAPAPTAPAPESTPPAPAPEEQADGPGRSDEAPGKRANHPRH